MVDFLRDFIKVLRLSDVRISSSETIDAMRVSSLIGLEDKNLLKQSLSQSLAKSMREKEIFADCFDNFFKEDFMNIDNSSKEEIDEKTVSDEIYESQPNNDLESLFKTSSTAEAFGMFDRGYLKEGMIADVNIIDFDSLRLHRPEAIFDLPAGGRRLVQRPEGYETTIKAGEIIFDNGVHTGALPGKLVRRNNEKREVVNY